MARYRRFYGDSDTEVMKLPARRFFVYVRNIDRIEAEETLNDMRRSLLAFHGGKEATKFIRELHDRIGRGELPAELKTIATPESLAAMGIGYVKVGGGEDDGQGR